MSPLLLGLPGDPDAGHQADGQVAAPECGCAGLQNGFEMLDVVFPQC